MRLTFRVCAGDQRFLIEPVRRFQHRPGHLDRIVERKLADDIDRRGVEMRKALGKLRADLDLDLVGQPADHLAEGQDLLVAVTSLDQKIGRVPQRARPALLRAAQNCIVEILQIRLRQTHLVKPCPAPVAQERARGMEP